MKAISRRLGFNALLVTQFLEAFNDNAMKVVVTFIAIDYFSKSGNTTLYVALAGVVFILPFLLFSTYAGYLADRFSKKTIIIFAKSAEVAIVLFSFWAFYQMNIWAMLGILFLMGLHSAFLSPSKYAILPEILPDDELSRGNGQLQMWTYVAIIIGQSAGGYILKVFSPDIHKVSYAFLLIAVVGVIASLFIFNVPAAGSSRKLQWNFLKDVSENVKYIRSTRAIFLSVIGLVYFAFLGGLFQPNILLYARTMMEVDPLLSSLLLVSISMGIGIGALLAGRMSDQKVELGLVPLGAIGLSIFSIFLGFNYHSYSQVIVTLFLLGLSSGFYIVPLNTLIQYESAGHERGKIIATNNFLSFTAILLASFAIYVLGKAGINPAQTFVLVGIATILGTIYICRILPYPLVRLCVWILAHTLYKIKVIDRQNVPAKGGALLVSNHVSFVDAVLIVVTTSRPIRFIMSREVYSTSHWLQPLFKIGQVIPIDRSDNPKELVRALHKAKECLKNGELVCIFPEGQLSRTGNILKFNTGVEHIIKGVDCPIIPINLDRIWGSIFSYEGGKFLSKWPKIIPYPVTVSYGKPLPPTTSAFELRSKVMELGSEAFQYRIADKMTLPEAFWQEARKHPRQFCIADSSDRKLNYGTTLISAVALARRLRGKLDQEKSVGVLIPPSVAGALVNIAVSILNKVPVNINYTSPKESLDSVVKQCAMQYVITSRAFISKINVTLPCEMIFIEDVISSISKKDKFKAALMSFAPAPLSRRLVFGPKSYREQAKLATIMFTSGSTGSPKGVMLTHANITSNIEGLYQVFHVKEKDVMVGILPFFHSFGFTGTLWFPLLSGIGAVYHVNPLDAKVIGKLVSDHKATILMTTPTFLSSYARRCEPEQLKTLRLVMVGAEKLKEHLAKEFQEKFGLVPMEGYGCTELSPVVSINLPDNHLSTPLQKANKPGTIGLPLPGIAVKIADQNTLEPLGPNQSGLLLIKGPNVMKGYLNQPEKTNEAIKDGWYMTGDIAQMDEDGFITITDRLSRFSKIGGEMVPHIKIEESIHEIVNSFEPICIVTAVPDDKRGERLIVLYSKEMDVSEAIEGLKKRGLPNLWIPDSESFFKIEAIPILGTGKTDLGAVKRKAHELYFKK